MCCLWSFPSARAEGLGSWDRDTRPANPELFTERGFAERVCSPSSKKAAVLPALSFPASLAATERWRAGFLTDFAELLGCSWSSFPSEHFCGGYSCLCLSEIQYHRLYYCETGRSTSPGLKLLICFSFNENNKD